jgi:hypothetical protein
VTADPALLEKIRHGRPLVPADVALDLQGLTEDTLLKVVDQHGDLVAVLRYTLAGRRLAYGCVVGPTGSP